MKNQNDLYWIMTHFRILKFPFLSFPFLSVYPNGRGGMARFPGNLEWSRKFPLGVSFPRCFTHYNQTSPKGLNERGLMEEDEVECT
jgi:hypothetical protein